MESIEYWWKDPDRIKPQYLQVNLSLCHFIHYKLYMYSRGIEPWSPWYGTDDQLPDGMEMYDFVNSWIFKFSCLAVHYGSEVRRYWDVFL